MMTLEATPLSMELVSVQYDFEYAASDGRIVSIKPNEIYLLVAKTNEHWWHVRKDQQTRPFYVPAQYMAELPPCIEEPESEVASEAHTMTHLGTAESHASTPAREISPLDFSENKPDVTPGEKERTAAQTLERTQTLPGPPATDSLQLYAIPLPNAQNKQSKISRTDEKVHQTCVGAEDVSVPSPPVSHIYDIIPEQHEAGAVFPGDTSASQQQSGNKTTKKKVEDEGLHTPVYVNVAQLRQSLSESPPSASLSLSPSYLDPGGWEVHVDQESGQEYYYHPATGHTTWDNPFLDSPTDPEPLLAEEPCSSSPPQSPAYSPSTASPPAWSSDWEQLVDESTGRPYFYNLMSGETSWEPPEQLSPYPPLMEPMSVHRFHEDGPPPLPEEDYPSEDYLSADRPEPYEELLAAGPPTLPKEYSLSHVNRTIIPRASLDRSTPSGWNLNVEPNGTWVFSSEHSPDQWVKSVDDQGQTYFYLKDGSRSQWNLPEAPAAPGQSRVENGVEVEHVSIIKNWRHTMGPVQPSSAQDDGRFVPTHRRNTSDYSSDSSSTGNSPETQHNVQNLEKAGILNKTKVSENGKKVRKNWAQTWTVLHGGVLTFHKDPKSATTGASNKTNQIVPEVTVDLRGAVIGWASKDKSSKKNVLELKGKNGVEFLIQYDTESIIMDWHKVLVDTIRQLEYQDHHSEEEDGDFYEKIPSTERDEKPGGGIERRRSSRPSGTSSTGETDQKRVRTKLMKFLMKRPTLQSVKEKGYIRDNVFGCHLATLCAQERTTVPSFVEKCVRAVERRGLDIDGLYRVSGNLAVIQKLRFKADHEELDLEDGQWEDVHVITGALKLFFRELPEPLFPYSHFHKFITAIRIPDYNTKVCCIYELVKTLPPANHDTMELLFGHLRRVIQYGEDNRMTVQNVAIVFGPTLLRPEMESANIAMHMVFQNQIVEFILNEYERIFHSS
ncbi:rho GTPase-activating protein 27 isoform 1-T2 [Aulostomus maculatus]